VRVAVVTPIPTPYRDGFWNVVARQPEIYLTLLYCAEGKADRPWQVSWPREFECEVLSGRNLMSWRSTSASCYWNRSICRRLESSRPDAIVVGGYNHPTLIRAVLYAKRNKIPYFLMCESHLETPRGRVRQLLKRSFVRWVVRNAAGGFPTGRLADAYLQSYGADASSLVALPNAPDVEARWSEAQRLQTRRDELRKRHGFSETPLVLFSGRLIAKKGVGILLEAFSEVVDDIPAQLAIVGDGPLRSELESRAAELGLPVNSVHFAGFVEPARLSEWYAMADVFVLPSSETWGVVVLEALASGLPVLVSDEVGCHPDVIQDDMVGEVVPARDVWALAAALQRRLRHLPSRQALGDAWAPVRESLSYENLATEFVNSIASRIHGTFADSGLVSGIA